MCALRSRVSTPWPGASAHFPTKFLSQARFCPSRIVAFVPTEQAAGSRNGENQPLRLFTYREYLHVFVRSSPLSIQRYLRAARSSCSSNGRRSSNLAICLQRNSASLRLSSVRLFSSTSSPLFRYSLTFRESRCPVPVPKNSLFILEKFDFDSRPKVFLFVPFPSLFCPFVLFLCPFRSH